MTLGTQIRKHRKRLGLTLEQLSELSGVDVGTISALEKRESSRSKFARSISAALGMTVEQLEDENYCHQALNTGNSSADLLPSSDTQNALIGAEFPASQKGGKMPKLATVSRLNVRDDQETIPQYETGGAMGSGLALPDQPGLIYGWQVNREWLTKNASNNTGVKNLCIVTGFGDSMRPMFNPGDPLMVDSGVKTVEADGIYFFRIGNDGFIKRLQRIPGDAGMVLWAISQNKDYKDFQITAQMDFEVLGKVIRVWCGTDF